MLIPAKFPSAGALLQNPQKAPLMVCAFGGVFFLGLNIFLRPRYNAAIKIV